MPLVDKKSKSQSVTYEAVGLKDDFSPIITNIDPDLTFYLSNFSIGPNAEGLVFNWLTEALKPPKVNAQLEMRDYQSKVVGSTERRSNNCQFFESSGRVSNAQRKVKKVYDQGDEFLRQKTKAFKEHARDTEYAIVSNAIRREGTDTVPALTGGVPYFLQEETFPVTFNAGAGTVVSTVDHGLATGDFIYFRPSAGATLPVEVDTETRYYVRLDVINPNRVFTIYPDMIDAINDNAAQRIAFSSAGTGNINALMNNIVDAGNTRFTPEHVNDVLEMCYYRGGDPTIAVMSGRTKRRFSEIMDDKITRNRDMKERKIVNVISSYESDYGSFTAKAHRMYPNTWMHFMDLDYWKLRWFSKPHEVTDLAKRGSYKEFVLESELGLEGTQPKASGAIINIKP